MFEWSAFRIQRLIRRMLERFGYTIVRAVPAGIDEEMRSVISRVRTYTMTRPARIVALCAATRYVVRAEVPGAIVECGVWRGGSMMAVALTLLNEGATDRDLFLYDTFKGMSAPTRFDVSEDGRSAARFYPRTLVGGGASSWAMALRSDVEANMRSTGYPSTRVHLVEGRVEETIPATAPESIALLRLDTDWYESTRHELEHLYGRISPGGVLLIDDYGSWKGARKAVDEFLASRRERILLSPVDSGSRIGVVNRPF